MELGQSINLWSSLVQGDEGCIGPSHWPSGQAEPSSGDFKRLAIYKREHFLLAIKNGQAFFKSRRREFQCQDIKLATLKVLWKDPDHFIFYAAFTTVI